MSMNVMGGPAMLAWLFLEFPRLERPFDDLIGMGFLRVVPPIA
jgi:hypothetical protein